MSAVANDAFTASLRTEAQGIQLGALSTSGQQISDPNSALSNGDTRTIVRHRVVASGAHESGDQDQDHSGGAENFNLATTAAVQEGSTPTPAALPADDDLSRISISTARTGSTLVHQSLQLTRQVTSKVEESKRIRRVVALFGFIAILLTILGF